MPNIWASAASMRSPADHSGTLTERCSDRAPIADHRVSHRPRFPTLLPDKGMPRKAWRMMIAAAMSIEHVREVEDRPVRQLQEVDHVTAQHGGRPEEPVGQVADDPAEQEAEADCPERRAETPGHEIDHEHRDHER